MEKRLLADDSVHTRVSKRNFQHIALDEPGCFLKPDALCQLLRACDARRGQFDTSDVGSVFVGQMTYRAAKARTEIGYARSIANLRPSGQHICSGDAAIMILVMGKYFFRT